MAFTNYVPIRRNLLRDPATRRIARACRIEPAHAVGCLAVLWAIADEYGDERDGHADVEWTYAELDAECGVPGFCAAMVAQGWLAETPTGARFVGYVAKAGRVEKQRMAAARRQAIWRQRHAPDGGDEDSPPRPPSPDPEGGKAEATKMTATKTGAGIRHEGNEKERQEEPIRNGSGVTESADPSRAGGDNRNAERNAHRNAERNTRGVTPPHHTTPHHQRQEHHTTPRAPPTARRGGGDGVSRGNGHGWLTRIRIEDLTDTTRLLAQYERAVAAGLIPGGPDGMLRCVTLAERALRVAGRAGNPPALFASLISRRELHRHVTAEDEDRAVARLKAHGTTDGERAEDTDRRREPTRAADRDEVLQ